VGLFFYCLLYPVFSYRTQAVAGGVVDRLRLMGFGHRHQFDLGWITTGASACGINLLAKCISPALE
jgi:hypothetical protein